MLETHLIPQDVAPMRIREQYPYPQWSTVTGDCECQQPIIARKRMERILGQAGIPNDCYLYGFDQFQHVRRARQFAGAFVEQDVLFDERGTERTGLLLYGPTGTGKTTLGSLVFLKRVEAGQAGIWQKYTDLVAKVRATYQDDYSGPSIADIRHIIQYARFLMIDDLGSLTRKDVYAEDMIEFMFLVMDHRWAKRLPTLITTNLNGDQLEAQFGAPVTSRIRGLCHTVPMGGADYRVIETESV